MVFFNYSTMQMAAKVVYYGPGLCGKTTNLQHIYSHTSSGSRGEMVSLETETDRTLFFDLLPLEVGKIQGFKTRIQLYTVPGQVFYNTTRKLVLKGVDGVVFVADSQRAMEQTNVESLANLEANLDEIGLTFDDVPIVLQYNKRDLADISSVEDLEASLNGRGWPSFEASALTGAGVFDTLRGISKLTLVGLKKRLTETSTDDPPSPPPVRPPAAVAPMLSPTVDVVDEPAPPTEAAKPQPEPETRADEKLEEEKAKETSNSQTASRRSGVDILAELEKIRQQAGQKSDSRASAPRSTTTQSANDDSDAEPNPSGAFDVSELPPDTEASTKEHAAIVDGQDTLKSNTADAGSAELGQPNPEIEFDLEPIGDSSELGLAEGEATLGTGSLFTDAPAARPDHMSGNGRRELEHSVAFHPSLKSLEQARRISFRLRIEDGNRSVVDTFDEAIQVDDPESIQHLLLNLRIALDPSGSRKSDSDE